MISRIKVKMWLLVASFICVWTASAQADSGKFGAGVVLGEPTGLSGKYWLTQDTALDGAVAWSVEGIGALHFHMDYLLHCRDIFSVNEEHFDLHYGLGGRIKLNSQAQVAARIPVGIDYSFKKVPIDLFVEVAGLLNLTPATRFLVNAGVGARYYF